MNMWYIGKPMNSQKKKGVIIIIIGICIPLIALPFISGYQKDKGLLKNFLEIGIKIKEKPQDIKAKLPDKKKGNRGRFIDRLVPDKIPFRFFLIPTFILIYIGIIAIDRARQRDG